MYVDKQLTSFHIIQKDIFNKNLVVWSYPTLSEENRTYILAKCFVTADEFVFFHKTEWIYIIRNDCCNVPNIKSYCIVLLAKDFEPTKYQLLCDILNKKYQKTNNPVELVKLFLNAFSTGSCCLQENGTQVTYNLRKVQENTKIKELIKLFGIETILIYNSLLLKKRVIVYHNDLKKLQMCLLSITKLMPCRNVNSYLHPFVENISSELRGINFYVAGIINKSQNFKADCYDIFVDLVANEITISPKAKENLCMTKTHKEIAMSLVQMVEKDLVEEQIISEISAKTDELLKMVRSLISVQTSNGDMITLEGLRSKNYNQALENFLFNLAIAENIMMV